MFPNFWRSEVLSCKATCIYQSITNNHAYFTCGEWKICSTIKTSQNINDSRLPIFFRFFMGVLLDLIFKILEWFSTGLLYSWAISTILVICVSFERDFTYSTTVTLSLKEYNKTQTHKHLAYKWKLKYLAKLDCLATRLSV